MFISKRNLYLIDGIYIKLYAWKSQVSVLYAIHLWGTRNLFYSV